MSAPLDSPGSPVAPRPVPQRPAPTAARQGEGAAVALRPAPDPSVVPRPACLGYGMPRPTIPCPCLPRPVPPLFIPFIILVTIMLDARLPGAAAAGNMTCYCGARSPRAHGDLSRSSGGSSRVAGPARASSGLCAAPKVANSQVVGLALCDRRHERREWRPHGRVLAHRLLSCRGEAKLDGHVPAPTQD